MLVSLGNYFGLMIPRGPRESDTTPDWTSSRIPYGSEHPKKCFELFRSTGRLDRQRSVDTSITLARNRFTASITWLRVPASARTLISESSRDTELSTSCSTILITLISLFNCLVICSSESLPR